MSNIFHPTLSLQHVCNKAKGTLVSIIVRILLLFMLIVLSAQHAWAQNYDTEGDYDEEYYEEDDDYLRESFIDAQTNPLVSYYVAQVTTNVNLRCGRSTRHNVITTIPQGSYVFLSTQDVDCDFRNVLYVGANLYGYINGNYLTDFRRVSIDESGKLQVESRSYKQTSDIIVKNSTDRYVTISVGRHSAKFRPYETRTFSNLPAARYKVMASSKGVIPYIGYDKIDSGYRYSWIFYIEREYH